MHQTTIANRLRSVIAERSNVRAVAEIASGKVIATSHGLAWHENARNVFAVVLHSPIFMRREYASAREAISSLRSLSATATL